MFEKDQKETFAAREERILKFWQEQEIFAKSLENREKAPPFTYYDGPPFATGLPHYGHILASTVKDLVARYKTMKGFFVSRRFGWDCHGLPVENEIEKAKELSGAPSIEKFGIANFNEECRKIVLRYTSEWEKTINRIGRWIDFSKTYKTMDPTFMETVWWVFKQLHEKDLVYSGFKVMPFSMKLGTPLSNFEANLNYQEVDDPSLTVKFKSEEQKDTFFLAWTTTPWTLISNLALIVGADIDYVKIKEKSTNTYYILAKARLEHYFKEKEQYKIIKNFKGTELKDHKYEPVFSYFKDRSHLAWRVLLDDFVSTEDGTGIVQAAPAFGEIDFFVCQREGIEVICPVDNNGRFTDEVPDFENVLVKDADKQIIKTLKKENKVFHHGTIRHRYPFCWRSDTPLIYKAVQTWFIAVEEIKFQLLNANEKIHWVPEHIKKGRFGKWLGGAKDWAVSRNRYWGTPLPIWKADDGSIHVIGSKKELEDLTGKKIDDLHRHFIDDLTFEKEGKVYKRVEEVFDCWFESGSMPYAQNHYPFENKECTEKAFPADFIAEGLDQTRGWFYTLTVLAAALFDQPAFKNVIVFGLILAEDGNKMSKRLKNYPEPNIIFDRLGADATRLYLLHSPVVKGDDFRFSEKGVELVLRQFLIPFWNSYVFLATYAKIYNWHPPKGNFQPDTLIDRWILSRLQKLIIEVQTAMDEYELSRAIAPFVEFIEQLTNWYIRRSRTRFWAEENTKDRREAFQTLYTVLINLSKVTAPFIPFISDAVYRELRTEDDLESVHLCDFPMYREDLRDHELEDEMEYVQKAVSMGHALRKDHKLKVRQPLSRAHIAVSDAKLLKFLKRQKKLIAEELNVKNIDLHENDHQFVSYIVQPNYRVLGKKVGKLMPTIKNLMQKFDAHQIDTLAKGQNLKINVDNNSIELTSEDVNVSRQIKEGLIALNDQHLVVAIETCLSPELLLEGLAREIINKVNTMRKEEGYDVSDRIRIILNTTDRVKSCFEQHGKLIQNEVLAVSVDFEECKGTKWDLNGEMTTILIEKQKL